MNYLLKGDSHIHYITLHTYTQFKKKTRYTYIYTEH